jgi:hypothetical protein
VSLGEIPTIPTFKLDGNRDTMVRARYPGALKWLPLSICLDGGYGRRNNAPSAISLVKSFPLARLATGGYLKGV